MKNRGQNIFRFFEKLFGTGRLTATGRPSLDPATAHKVKKKRLNSTNAKSRIGGTIFIKQGVIRFHHGAIIRREFDFASRNFDFFNLSTITLQRFYDALAYRNADLRPFSTAPGRPCGQDARRCMKKVNWANFTSHQAKPCG